MELQQRCELADDVLRGPVLLLLLQAAVGLDDLGQLVCQIILTPAAAQSASELLPMSAFYASLQAPFTLSVSSKEAQYPQEPNQLSYIGDMLDTICNV